MKCQRLLPSPSSRLFFAAFTAAGALLSSSAKAANYDSLTTTNYNWSTTTAWNPTAPAGGPGAGDTANLLSVGANRTVSYDAGATGTVGAINITENAAFQNYFEIKRSLAFTSISLLNSATGALARIRLLDANTLDINTGSSVLFGATTGTVVGGTVIDRTGTQAGSVNIGGGTLTLASPTSGVTQQVSAPINLTSGTIDIQSVGTGTSRLQANNDFSASGGTIQFSGTNAANGSLFLSGNVTIGGGVTLASSAAQLIVGNSAVDQTFSMGVATADFTLRNATTAAGTSTTKTVTSTAAGNAIGSIILQNGVNTSGTNALTFKLGSNLNVATGKSLVSFNLGTPTSTQNTVIDLNGFTYDGTAAASTAFAPANNVAAKIQINSSATGGTFRTGSFNLSGSDIALGPNTTLQATGTAANNLGVIASGTGNIDASSRFLYTGTAATLTSSRTIGRLEVGDSTNASTLTLSGATLTTGGTVTVRNAGTLALGTTALTTPAGQNVSIDAGGILAAGSTNLNQALVDRLTTASAGVLALSTDVAANLNFTNAPNVSLGATGSYNLGDNPLTVSLTPGNNTYRLGGGGGTLQVRGGLLAGAGNNLVVSGGVVSIITANTTYGGSTTVNDGGTLRGTTNARIPATTALTVNGTGVFDLGTSATAGDNTQSIASLSGNGTVTINSGVINKFIRVNGTTSTTFSGAITNVTQSLGLIKDGTSTLTLSGNGNSYTGTTSVNGGTLLVNGNASAATGAVTVATGATLGGSGSLGGATTVNGQLSVGANAATPGILTFTSSSVTGALTLTGMAAFDLNGTGGVANRGVTYDAVNVTGALVYGGALMINANGALVTGATYDLFDFGSQSGAFSSITIGDGSTYQSSFNYSTGVLTITAVPEPSTLVGGAIMLTALGWHLCRRRSAASRA